MRRSWLLAGLAVLIVTRAGAQQVAPILDQVKQRLDSVLLFEARVRMEVDISFVNMPVKHAEIRYEKGKPLRIASEDFALVPKRGLDFTLNELYRYPFMTLDMGQVQLGGRPCQMIKVIPTTDASEYAIATLWLDPKTLHLLKSQISTKKNGVFEITYGYARQQDILPRDIEVAFEVAGIKIPLRFLGKDTRIDREKMNAEPEQKGSIFLQLSDLRLSRL